MSDESFNADDDSGDDFPSETDEDDGSLNTRALSLGDTELKKKHEITIINTNACSLSPKIDSLLDCFSELEADIAVVTETWLQDGDSLDHDLADLEDGAGIASLTRNRDPHPVTGVSHGGVAILYKKRIGLLEKLTL